MIEFWAVIGLACLDRVFLEQLKKYADDVETVVRDYGFRLSRWEMGELKRVLSIPKVRDVMHMICEEAWDNAFDPRDEAPCWWSAARSAKFDDPDAPPYQHPLENDQPVPKGGHRAGGS